MPKGTSLNATKESLSLDSTIENLQATSKGKTKKKPPPKMKGLSLNTIEEKTSKSAYSYIPTIFSRKKKPPPKLKLGKLNLH